MSNYAVWTVEMLGARIVEWRERLRNARTKGEVFSIWGEIEKMEAEFDRAVFEGRTEASRREASMSADQPVYRTNHLHEAHVAEARQLSEDVHDARANSRRA